VLRKNRWVETPYYDITPQPRPFIDRLRPGKGCRHLLLKSDIQRFIELLPNWEQLSEGLNAILLARFEFHLLGWHRPGRVAICAWERDLVQVFGASVVWEDRPILDLLGVVPEPVETEQQAEPSRFLCRFTEWTARGYQLLAVLLHELGHHHDRMTTRKRHDSCRGEPYAVNFANRLAWEIWPRYLQAFAE
jgi:hypothetical protein